MSTVSLSKDLIQFVLLEGIHPVASEVLATAGYNNVKTFPTALPADQLKEALAGAHFVGIRSRTNINKEILAAANKLVAIGCFCIGTNQVDLEAAELAGVPVFNAPFSNTRSVAELVLAQIVFLMRGIPAKNAAAHRGQWLKSATGSFETRGKKLGIVGYGHIGSQLGVLAEGLGMQVSYFDVENKLPLGNARPVNSLTTLLGEVDVVSLHVPETPETQLMFGAQQIMHMQKGSYLINASRGSVVDIDALAAALESEHIAGAAIDVFPVEPKSNADEFVNVLRQFDNVILTPHIGGSTHEAQESIAADVAAKLIRYSDNGSTAAAVNFPAVSMPDHYANRRILHVHKNVPGVMEQINRIFASHKVNIAAQYLQTSPRVGYVVMDVELEDATALVEDLRAVPGTIRTRLLH
ncbi:MAG: phosphoglycerate dehydrogenase [Gammaproteobacteria bacterium]|nr:phosphoglycerate dehydrogenase [Gammaproteobacteria bacterium]